MSGLDQAGAAGAVAALAATEQRHCVLCGSSARPIERQPVRCNVRRYRDRRFELWRCAQCASLHCESVPDLAAYYADYPIRHQRLDYFSRSWYGIVLRRLQAAGLTPEQHILDYGCNQGLFIDFLAENGYRHCAGFDPYVERFNQAETLARQYDWVISLDVIEHDDAPRAFLTRLAGLLKPGGRLCLETPNADGIDLSDTEQYIHAIHVPFHQHILSQQALRQLGQDCGLQPIATYERWYMDSWPPGTSRRLFETLMLYAGNDLDVGYEPPRIGLFWRHPSLLVWLFFGYWLPQGRRDHMMMILSAGARGAQ